MLYNKLTPNEVAKLEVYNRVQCALFDGAKDEYPKATDKEAEALEKAVNKHTRRIHKLLGMDKIYDKLES